MNMLVYRPVLSLSDLTRLEQARALYDPANADDAIWRGYVIPERAGVHSLVGTWDCDSTQVPNLYRAMTLVAREDYCNAMLLCGGADETSKAIAVWVWAHMVDPDDQKANNFINSMVVRSEFLRRDPNTSLTAHYFRTRATRVLIYRMKLRRDSKWRRIESQALMAETAINQCWERERNAALEPLPPSS